MRGQLYVDSIEEKIYECCLNDFSYVHERQKSAHVCCMGGSCVEETWKKEENSGDVEE